MIGIDNRVADADLRVFGVDIVGDVAWGTHFCQFYQTKEDLIDTLIPYFTEGLRNKEFCMWITSPPLEVEEAKEALRKAVQNLDEYIRNGQIEILSYIDWYLINGVFNADKVLEGWTQKEKNALKNGFDGLRLTGNTFWIERSCWESFVSYEARINKLIGSHRMIALCTYSLEKCTCTDVVDVIKNHEGTLIRKNKNWYLVEDVAKRKKMEEEINSIAKFPSENPEPILRISKDGTILYSNSAGLSLLKNWKTDIHQLAPDDWRRLIADTLLLNIPKEVEERLGKQTFSMLLVPLAEYVNIYGRDITQNKEFEEKLREYANHLEELVKEETEKLKESEKLATIGQLAGMVGHDIRNPLQTIEAVMYLARAELNSSSESSEKKKSMEEMIQEIEKQTSYINKIVSDLQDYSRQLIPELEEIDIRTLIRDSLSLITIPKEVTLSMIIEDNKSTLAADPAMMKRVLINLITNALQSMSNGGILTIRASQNRDGTFIVVEDTGVGIPEEIKAKIFNPLFTTKSKGQGLGLAVCKRLVEAHGGEIHFESEVGKGTIFVVKIHNKQK